METLRFFDFNGNLISNLVPGSGLLAGNFGDGAVDA